MHAAAFLNLMPCEDSVFLIYRDLRNIDTFLSSRINRRA